MITFIENYQCAEDGCSKINSTIQGIIWIDSTTIRNSSFFFRYLYKNTPFITTASYTTRKNYVRMS